MTKVIAEAGVNHNGSIEMAFELVDIAIAARADFVKFQTFKAERLVNDKARLAGYQKRTVKNVDNQLEMLKKLELSYQDFKILAEYCLANGVEFLSTAFDSESLNFLVEETGIKCLKIASGEMTNGPLLLEHAQTGRDIILSTGMCTVSEIKDALGVIAFGYLNRTGRPSDRNSFSNSFESSKGQAFLKEKVCLLHCTTEYPAPLDEVNLRAMSHLEEIFGLAIGYSDHTQGITVPIAAAAKGARYVEKHFTSNRELDGPDHFASLEPNELKTMVSAIREVNLALGSAEKGPTKSEQANLEAARKSIIVVRDIKAGDIIREEDLSIMRPYCGVSPMLYWQLIGQISKHTYRAGDFVIEQ